MPIGMLVYQDLVRDMYENDQEVRKIEKYIEPTVDKEIEE